MTTSKQLMFEQRTEDLIRELRLRLQIRDMEKKIQELESRLPTMKLSRMTDKN